MKKFLSTKYSAGAFNFAMLLLRVAVGVLVAHHGFGKLTHFNEMKEHFMNFMGLGSTLSLGLDIFAEFFCSVFLVLGLFTRLAVIPIIIVMLVAFVKVQHSDLFVGEKEVLFLISSIVILFCGPGRISVDGMVNK